MFAYISRILRSKWHDRAAARTSAPQCAVYQADGAPLAYRPELVPELTHEHRLLEASFASLVAAHRSNDVEACIFRLTGFTNILRAHLLKENLQLYRYLRHAFPGDHAAAARTQALRAEMQEIGKALNAFANAYLGATWDEHRRRRLGRDLNEMGQILAQRIATEELALYPLYLPPKHP